MEVSIDAMRDAQSDQSSTAGGPNTQEGKEVVRWKLGRTNDVWLTSSLMAFHDGAKSTG
jgi:hypothetical protein